MRRNLLIFLGIAFLSFAATGAGAQNAFTAYNLTDIKPEGTARSIAMGNAMTALGGDFGAISINPAASAVYRYNEIGITPAFYTSNIETSFGGVNTNASRTTFGIANFGGVSSNRTWRTNEGLVGWSFGFTYNKQNNYNTLIRNNADVTGSSYADALASGMDGYYGYDMDMNNSQYPYDYFGVGMWPHVNAWNGSLVDTLDTDPRGFVPGTYYDAGRYRSYQSYSRKQYGNTSVSNINVGANISNKLYIGMNIGLYTVWNKVSEDYSEESLGADGHPAFSDSGFDYMKQIYHQTTSGNGIGLQFGLIYTPVPFVRLGASVSTPTWYYLTDKCYWDTFSAFEGNYSALINSPEAVFEYRVNTPFKYSLGAAFTFPWGAFSIDYEGSDYSQARVRNSFNTDKIYHEDFRGVNSEIRGSFDHTDKFRVGAEINPLPHLSFRGGFQYGTAGLKKELFGKVLENYVGSFGFGYSSKGGFFTDIAYQQSIKKESLTYDAGDVVANYVCAETPIRKSDWRLLFTFGYRF